MKKLNFNYQSLFHKYFDGTDHLTIMRCSVCKDLTCYQDSIDINDLHWYISKDIKICNTCLNGYILEKEAKELDKENISTYGSKYIDDVSNQLIRDKYTWDEAQFLHKQYKEELIEYLKNNRSDIYEEYIDILEQ